MTTPRHLRLYASLTSDERARYHVIVLSYEAKLGKLNDHQKEYILESCRAGFHPSPVRVARLGAA